MAATKSINATVVAVVNTLIASLNAEVDAVAAQWTDGIPLLHPVKILPFWRPPQQLVMGASGPVVVVSSRGGRTLSDGALGWQEMAHMVEVTALVRTNDLYQAEAQAARYLEAIQEALVKHQQLDNSLRACVGVQLGRYGKSMVLSSPAKEFLGYNAGWEVTIRLEELMSKCGGMRRLLGGIAGEGGARVVR